uniref:EF-hand domain-containing protein n=1 Tax=Corethron hystrix TaxID=216773 RepID=A0A6U5EJ03_9STRA|mmetsp:Transcript_17838/g.40528  ORF Transcript_17838/g.40528 Transcript_17838/m.40528 type:complete len:639 (+) Transcript_17838:207-2123(+)
MNYHHYAILSVVGFGILPTGILASICSGNNASPNWYGSVGYPPYFTRKNIEKCPQKYELSSCEQSAVMRDGTSDFSVDESGMEVCNPSENCFPTKQNCKDTLVCSDLLKLKEELLNGGHNIVCRHEKTYWQGYTGEVKNCHAQGNCLDPEVKPTQRQLQPYGWESANKFATAFREMDIPISKTFSSPFTRCSEHASLFSDDPNEERLELLYMGGWKEVLELNNITQKVKPNALKWQAYNLRNFAGKKPPEGKNNIMVTHGFNIKLAFGTAVDEGYCLVLKPSDNEPSLAESIGSLEVSNRVFTFDDDSFPVDAIARMSPESAVHMQTCDDVRSDSIINPNGDVIASYDTNHDMKITLEEFLSGHGSLKNYEGAFDFIRSIFIQPELLGKSVDSPSIELGQFFHLNWGWREFATSGGNIAYPWRIILQNTIGSGGKTATERVMAFKQANAVLSDLIIVLKDDSKYPSRALMEDKLLNCGSEIQSLHNCEGKMHITESGGDFYYPIGSGDSGAANSNGGSVFGVPLAYPSEWKPSDEFYESKILKVASCIATHNSASAIVIDQISCNTASKTHTTDPLLQESSKVTEALAWTFGTLFILLGLTLVYIFRQYIPHKIEENSNLMEISGKTMNITDHRSDQL